MKKALIMMTAFSLVVASLTGCGKNGSNTESGAESSGLEYDVTRENMDELESSETEESSTTDSEDSSETEESSEESSEDESSSEASGGGNSSSGNKGSSPQEFYEDKDAPNIVVNPDVVIYGEKNVDNDTPLYKVKVNGKYIDIRHETTDTLLNTAGIRQDVKTLKYNEDTDYRENGDEYSDGIFFYGRGYGIYSNYEDESKRYTGTHLFIEGVENGLVAVEVDPTAAGVYSIRGVYASIAMTRSDFDIVFANDVKCGMSREAVEKKLGEGNKSRDFTYYANDENALLIRYDEDDNAAEIYLFNDFEFLPIDYREAEEEGADDSKPQPEKEGEDDNRTPVRDKEEAAKPEETGEDKGETAGGGGYTGEIHKVEE